LGVKEPDINPFALAKMPNLTALLGSHRLVHETIENHTGCIETKSATLIALDPTLGVGGPPQSASGQSVILTGQNIPKIIGKHYGPKPNQAIRDLLKQETLFHHLKNKQKNIALLNAYPQGYFDALDSGRRLPGAIAMAALNAGLSLKTTADFINGEALSADFTGEGWRSHLNVTNAPIYSPVEAGKQLGELARRYDFSFFEYWLSDYAGHRAKMEAACSLVEKFDSVLGGLLKEWDFAEDIIFLTSDHGNLEDIRTRKHTHNPVPGLVIGPQKLRERFAQNLTDLTGIAPAILNLFSEG
jgi:predicted AlkP superfamily pyrophosphatase or phosphodiesterase